MNSAIINYVSCSFLEGPKAALVASKDFDNGHYKSVPQHGIRAFGRAYSAWAYGQTVSNQNVMIVMILVLCTRLSACSGSVTMDIFMTESKFSH